MMTGSMDATGQMQKDAEERMYWESDVHRTISTTLSSPILAIITVTKLSLRVSTINRVLSIVRRDISRMLIPSHASVWKKMRTSLSDKINTTCLQVTCNVRNLNKKEKAKNKEVIFSLDCFERNETDCEGV